MFKKMAQKLKNEKGLTLIELLAVIVILGIIAAIAIPSIGGIIQKSKEDAVKADAIAVLNAAKVYVAANPLDDTGKSTITKGQLDEYVENVGLTSYTVTYEDKKYTLKGEGKAGKINISFNGATIDEINKAAKGAETIPPAKQP
ncbi:MULTISPECIES: prepilin-type N-terminal cleavage/methylation domain-containing protein [Bacillus]|uniref:prepilin-type N-terminal cleavage/methylation domain-containing protein n=1 Tax=Bacillus TaxID=1386 RepID=UPI002882399D|nr:prepilin-type N-terminal cleavage/methylation domain-containing protein [Bacillus sp. AG4(2022)]MDT0161913.1 prepilin-type N-terminal cleavage/methylation domain-containing protein [Bacillus sp. AG4(2022)]